MGGNHVDLQDKTSFFTLLSHLVEAPGPTGGEEPRRLVLEEFLRKEGLPFQVDAAGNLEVVLTGKKEAAALILDAHMDVVGQGYGVLHADEKSFSGPGVADNLAAVCFLALLARKIAKKSIPLSRPLHLLFSTAEEGEGNLAGIRHYIERRKQAPFAFLCLDLGMDSYALCAVGSIRYRVCVTGAGGHSWGDWGRKNAISVLSVFLLEAEKLSDQKDAPEHGRLTFNVGAISGGEGINLIAQNAEALFEFRSTDPARLLAVEKELDQLKNAAALPLSLTCMGKRPASKAVHSSFLEKAILKAALEENIPIHEKPISSNANASLAAGWPSVTFGICRCGNIHRPDEFLIRESLDQGWRFLWRILEKLNLFS